MAGAGKKWLIGCGIGCGVAVAYGRQLAVRAEGRLLALVRARADGARVVLRRDDLSRQLENRELANRRRRLEERSHREVS